MKTMSIRNAAAITGLLLGAASASALPLGTFTFNDLQFGNSLVESDGGTFRNDSWLNIVNANPGNPGALTGVNFDTGIANIGLFGSAPVYTISYNTPIANQAGADLGIVSARYSLNDTFELAVSTDGVNFTAPVGFGPGLAVATGVGRDYFYAGAGLQPAYLFVTPVDLDAFGLGSGASIVAVQVTAFPEGDLIRIAGMNAATVPEAGSTLALLGSALALLALFRRKLGRG
jgi:hypothetical protein